LTDLAFLPKFTSVHIGYQDQRSKLIMRNTNARKFQHQNL